MPALAAEAAGDAAMTERRTEGRRVQELRVRGLEAELGDLTEPEDRGGWLPVESPRRRPAAMARREMPGGRPPAPRDAGPGRRKSAEPTIRVYIQRIEVRPLEEKPKPGRRKQEPVFSLEDYLSNRRREGW